MVLVVDDNDDVRNVVLMLLSVDGYEAHGAATGEAAIDFVRARRPHCVILDVGMPTLDGLDVLANIRADPALAGVRVIVFSAYDGETRRQAMCLGADEFVLKGSLDWARMFDTLRKFCRPGTGGGLPASSPSLNKDVG